MGQFLQLGDKPGTFPVEFRFRGEYRSAEAEASILILGCKVVVPVDLVLVLVQRTV